MTKVQSSEICRMDSTALLDPNAPLFRALAENSPHWWSKLLTDPEIYIEIRKSNLIHVYYYGARIAEIKYSGRTYSVKCHEKYVDGDQATGSKYVSCISLLENDITRLKENAIKFYVQESEGEDTSEKRIQGRLRIDNPHRYIDSEFAHAYVMGDDNNLIRFDLVAVDGNVLKIEELKRIGDSRLRTSEMEINPPEVLTQMERYAKFMAINQDALCVYYQTLLKIKAMLGLPMPIGYDAEKPFTLDLTPLLLIKNLYDYSKMSMERYERLKDIRDILEKNEIRYYILP
ncbi:MAG: hypothetical protein K2K93_05235 [Muribaculaceae bacterium]|nr:hypothetical protein [Muribaculaceae bacterium]